MSQLIYKKMVDVMRDVGPVSKDQKNTAQGYKFRGIDQFVNALHPALIKNGVFLTVEVLERTEQLKDVERSNGKRGVDKHVALKVKYSFHAEDGSSVSSTLVSEALDSSDKSTNKALSAAFKYALIQTFSVPTEDMEEADRTTPEIGTPIVKSDADVKATSPMNVINGDTKPEVLELPKTLRKVSFRKPGTKVEAAPINGSNGSQATKVKETADGWE